jgi:ribosomal protein S18 acetylase RimI-like enzyme
MEELWKQPQQTGMDYYALGVEENKLAYKFWNRMGFEFVRKIEPRQFGDKTQTVIVMRRMLL